MASKQYQIFKIGTGANAPQKYKTCEDCGADITEYRILIDGRFVCMDCVVKGYVVSRSRIFKIVAMLFRVGKNLLIVRDNPNGNRRKEAQEEESLLETTGEEAGTWNPGRM